MIKLCKSDKNILKTFLGLNEPPFVIKLDLRYELDYYYGITFQMLKKTNKLNVRLEPFPLELQNRILEYIEKNGNYDDIIYWNLINAVYTVFCKYYNNDGTPKH